MRPDYGRYFLGFLDSNLNKPVTKEMHTYDDNCELEWANIWDNFDHYYVVHLCNWFLASLVIRDTYILHFWHVFDEIIELSLQHILAHFRECWWDHILMDIMLSNIPAVIAGMVFIRYTGIREMDWLGRTGKKSWKDWDVFHCHKKMGVLFYQQMLLCLHFANGFFLLNAFLIPPKHAFPILRLLGWFGFGAVGMREAYIDAETWNTPERKHKPVAGRYRWLAVAILTTETIVCYKYRMDTGNISFVPTPWYIWVPWTLSLGSLACFWAYLRFKPDHTVKYPGIEEEERKKAKKQKSIKSSPKIQRSPSRSPRKSKHE
jgi:phosphatidylserine synthase 2